MKNSSFLNKSIIASIKAGMAILEVYHSDFSVEYKDDDSPLTIADKKSHDIICEILSETDIPILSEEGKAINYEDRKNWRRLWIVDPLDGTKEYIKRNGEFTVNIALVENNEPILGVIFVPVTSTLYYSAKDFGSFKVTDTDLIKKFSGQDINSQESDMLSWLAEHSESLPLKKTQDRSCCNIVGSRSHATPELEEYVEQKKKAYKKVDFISAGSSLKFCLVAEGTADIYPRLGPTMEWDTAAGQAIAENSGCTVRCWDTGAPLAYNREDLLNPYFIIFRPGYES